MDGNREFAVSETFSGSDGDGALGWWAGSRRLTVAVPARHRGRDSARRHRGVCRRPVTSGQV